MPNDRELHYRIAEKFLYNPIFQPIFTEISKDLCSRIKDLEPSKKASYLFNLEKEIISSLKEVKSIRPSTSLSLGIALMARALIATYLGYPYPEPVIKSVEDELIKRGREYNIKNYHLLPLLTLPRERARYERLNKLERVYDDVPDVSKVLEIPELKNLLIDYYRILKIDTVDEKMMNEKYKPVLEKLMGRKLNVFLTLIDGVLLSIGARISKRWFKMMVRGIFNKLDEEDLTKKPTEVAEIKMTCPLISYLEYDPF